MSSVTNIEALVVHCIDYRFVSLTKEFLEKEGLKDNYDLLAFPGSSKSLYLLLDAISVSERLHHPKKIILIDHEDCGAFGENNSLEDHQESLEKAKQYLKISYPNLPVETYVAKFSGVERLPTK